MTTKSIGDISEAVVIAALLKSGVSVLVPFGDKDRYDVVTERNGTFERIQIKTGRIKHGALRFYTESITRRSGKRVALGYRGQVEKFAVYCQDNDTVYVIPVAICAKGNARFRIASTEGRKGPKCPAASDFILGH